MSYCGKKNLLRLNVEGKLTCDQAFFFAVENTKVGGRKDKGKKDRLTNGRLRKNPCVELRSRIKGLSYCGVSKELGKAGNYPTVTHISASKKVTIH